MRLKDLIHVLNMNITFDLEDRLTYKNIDYQNLSRKEHDKVIERRIYMIFPTSRLNHLHIVLY